MGKSDLSAVVGTVDRRTDELCIDSVDVEVGSKAVSNVSSAFVNTAAETPKGIALLWRLLVRRDVTGFDVFLLRWGGVAIRWEVLFYCMATVE